MVKEVKGWWNVRFEILTSETLKFIVSWLLTP